MDPQSAIAHLSWLQITQVTPPHMPSPISDTNELVAEDDPAPDLDPPGAQEAPAFCGRYKVRTYSRPPQHASISPHPPYAVGTGSNAQGVSGAAAGAACWTRSQRMEAVPAKVRNGHSALV